MYSTHIHCNFKKFVLASHTMVLTKIEEPNYMGLYKEMHEAVLEDIEQKVQHPLLEFSTTVISCGTLFNVIMVQTTSLGLSCNVTFPLTQFLSSVKAKNKGSCKMPIWFKWVVDYTTHRMSFLRINSCYYVNMYTFNPCNVPFRLFHSCSILCNTGLFYLSLCWQGTNVNMAPRIFALFSRKSQMTWLPKRNPTQRR